MKGKYRPVEAPADLANSNQVHQPRFAGWIRVLRAYFPGSNRRPVLEMLMVAIDFSEVRFE